MHYKMPKYVHIYALKIFKICNKYALQIRNMQVINALFVVILFLIKKNSYIQDTKNWLYSSKLLFNIKK